MPARACLAVIALALSAVGAGAQTAAPSDAAKEMVGAWEISISISLENKSSSIQPLITRSFFANRGSFSK
jgi:invasion protein IalB